MLVILPPGNKTIADVGEEKLMVMVPSFPSNDGDPVYGHEMHWPPVYLPSVAVNIVPDKGPEARYHCGAPPTVYE